MRLLTFIITINSIICFGQDLYVDNIKDFPWTSDAHIDQIQETKEIGLSILRLPKDSLKTDRTIWTFKDDLTLSFYNTKNRSEQLVLRCSYDLDPDKRLINIEWPDKGRSTYQFTFVSTGSFMLLTRKKIRSER